MPIEFRCSQCSQLLRVPDASVGKNARCPKCQTLMTVPAASSAAPPSPPTPPAFAPPTSPLAPAPLFAPPAPATAKEPSPFAEQGVSGFSDSGPASAFPSDKPADNPFGDQPGTNPFGGPATGSVNPYASPAMAAYGSAYAPQLYARTGLPWENEPRSLGCWFRTFSIILGSPTRAFSIMQQGGDIGTPLTYVLYGVGLPLLALSLIAIPIFLIFLVLLVAGAFGQNGRPNEALLGGAGMLVGIAVAIVIGLAFYFVLIVLLSFVYAGIWHLGLLLTGGAKQGFATTYRVTNFAYGSVAWIGFIPYIGGPALLIWAVVLLIIGLSKAHEVPAGKPAIAVLLPVILCCGGYVAFVFIVLFSSAMAGN